MSATQEREPLRILLVVRWPVGGIRTYLKYVYGQFDPSRYAISLVTAATDEADPIASSLKHSLLCRYELPNEATPLTWVRTIWEALRVSKATVVHSHGFTAGMLALPAARLRGVSHVCTVHDVLQAGQLGGLTNRLRLQAMRTLLPRIDVLQTVGNDATANLLHFIPALSKNPRKVVSIRNGIRSDLFIDATTRDLRTELGIAPGTFLIGFFGRFMSQKGFRYLVDAVALLASKKSTLPTPVVVSFGGGGFIREEQAAIEARGLSAHFFFLPFVDNIGSCLRGVDVVAIPSLWEACPLLPMEAMASGAPVIGTHCIGLKEVLQDTPATMVPVADPVALAAAIEQHMRAGNGRDAALNFASVARHRFDCGNTARALEDLLWSLPKSR